LKDIKFHLLKVYEVIERKKSQKRVIFEEDIDDV